MKGLNSWKLLANQIGAWVFKSLLLSYCAPSEAVNNIDKQEALREKCADNETMLPPDSNSSNGLCLIRMTKGSCGMSVLFSTGVRWEHRRIHWTLREKPRPAQTQPGSYSCMRLPDAWITWNISQTTAMRGIWGRLTKQKLCLDSDIQWSSTDQLGKANSDNQRGVEREGELSLRGKQGNVGTGKALQYFSVTFPFT